MHIRLARSTDALAVAGVHVRSWQAGYRGLLPDDYLANLCPEDRASHYTLGQPFPPTTLVALEMGVVAGFATIGTSRDADATEDGELLALYVDPPAWGRGIGRSLMTAARKDLVEHGFSAAVLWVLVGNERAERFYRLDGWRPDGSQRQNQVWDVEVNEVRYRSPLF
jgi:ribosomal protein S18 acetylase RimI-like enzyme